MVAGEVELVEINQTRGAGTLLGEIGLFTPNCWIMTVRCKTDVEAAKIGYDQIKELYFQNSGKSRFKLSDLIVAPLQSNAELAVPELPNKRRVGKAKRATSAAKCETSSWARRGAFLAHPTDHIGVTTAPSCAAAPRRTPGRSSRRLPRKVFGKSANSLTAPMPTSWIQRSNACGHFGRTGGSASVRDRIAHRGFWGTSAVWPADGGSRSVRTARSGAIVNDCAFHVLLVTVPSENRRRSRRCWNAIRRRRTPPCRGRARPPACAAHGDGVDASRETAPPDA